MPHRSPGARQRRSVPVALPLGSLAVLVLAIFGGCDERLSTELAVGETRLTITGMHPTEAEQGELLNVHIYGEGFTADAAPSWQRNGTTDTHIEVESVSFVSETELRAAISVAPGADVDLYDVVVTRKSQNASGAEDLAAIATESFTVNETLVTVTEALPAEAEQGQSLIVEIHGEGFTYDAVPSWDRDGAPDTLIVVDAFALVNETELRARITVAPGAEPDLYDIIVTRAPQNGSPGEVFIGFSSGAFTVTETPIAVTGTDPPQAEQGETLEVRIYGKGFTEDAVPTWEREGVTQPLIDVSSVNYISESELRANVSISQETDIGLYDVAVTTTRKKGVGSEKQKAVGVEIFEVGAYTPIPLGWLPSNEDFGQHAQIFDINEDGVIIGRDNCCAFRWSESEGMVRFAGDSSLASSINNKGWIVGTRKDPDDRFGRIPYIFENGRVIDLASFDSLRTEPTSINDEGTIVGSASGKPVIWRRRLAGGYASPIELPAPGGESLGVESGAHLVINARGDVAGKLSYETAVDIWQDVGVLWQVRPDRTYGEPIILDGSSRDLTVNGINESGWIVGWTFDGGNNWPVAVVWHPNDYSRAIPLDFQGTRGAWLYDVTDHGQVVGLRFGEEFKPYSPFPGGTQQAALWQLDRAGNTIDVFPLLPADGYSDSDAAAMNASGWIVGTSGGLIDDNWVQEATLWRPED